LAKGDGDQLAAQVEAAPETSIEIDLEAALVRAGGKSYPFAMKAGAREALVAGQWDPLAVLLDAAPEIQKVASALPYLNFG
jgi:3-isopropylmalate/(R)-2-methylmalate dehydratase small subunit